MPSLRQTVFATVFATAVLNTAPASAETIKELAQHTHFHGIAFARSGTAKLLLATHHGLFAVDAEGSATQVSAIQDYMGFSPDPSNPLIYYSSGHPAGGGNSGFLKSADGGATWTQVSAGAGGPVDFHQMDVSPADPATIYGIYGNVQVSHDGGANWSVAGPAPGQVIAIAASVRDADSLYAATKAGLEMSNDGGKSWSGLAFNGEVVSTVETGADGALYAFVIGRGLMLGKDGETGGWPPLSNGFGEAIPLHMAVDPADGKHLALTTQNNEVLESHDGGKSWVAFAGQ
ncbi:MAG: WD40/YVTN/BNR-like repeat-containing protein [Aestuariivirga sp.]